MPSTGLPDNIRASDPEALACLRRLNRVVTEYAHTEQAQAKLMRRRNELLTFARRNLGVSWADLARVAGVSDVSVIQAVERYERDHPDADLAFD